MPNELTPARRGFGPAGHGRAEFTTKNGVCLKSIFGFGASKCRLGGSSRACRAGTVLMKPAMPAGVVGGPVLVFTQTKAPKMARPPFRPKGLVQPPLSVRAPGGGAPPGAPV